MNSGRMFVFFLCGTIRSPSPEPIYGTDGKRLNTREFRTRRKLEEERHAMIQKMLALNPEFKPPVDYKPPITRVSDKVMIPQEEHPEINFVGLLIGPRGNTLKCQSHSVLSIQFDSHKTEWNLFDEIDSILNRLSA